MGRFSYTYRYCKKIRGGRRLCDSCEVDIFNADDYCNVYSNEIRTNRVAVSTIKRLEKKKTVRNGN